MGKSDQINSSMSVIDLDISSIIPYDKNPRINDEAATKLCESIKAFGFRVPVLLDENNVIIAGHTRYKAAKQLGMKTLPCIYCHGLSEAQVKAFRIADNKYGEASKWDVDLLQFEIQDLEALEFDLTTLGFSDDEINAFVDNFNIDDSNRNDESNQESDSKSQIIKTEFELIISCTSEDEQESLYNEMTERGLKCRVLGL